jgi:hypothetical protein
MARRALTGWRCSFWGMTGMLKALVADAIFIATLFAEVLASLSLLQSTHLIALREEFEPILAFYHASLAPVLAVGLNLFWHSAPQWFVDAAVLSAILFFLFFIARARKAMAPYEPAGEPSAAEAFVDWLLPAVFCAAGALVLGPTLLPLLTLPAALLIGILQLAGRQCRFELSRGYYVNLLCLGAVLGGILILQR